MTNSKKASEIHTEHFNTVYDKTFAEMRRFVAGKCSDPSYISDILQETYFAYYNLILTKGTDFVQNDLAMLHKIAKRKIYSYYSLKEKLACLIPLFLPGKDNDEYCVADQFQEYGIEAETLSAVEADRIWGIISSYPADVRKIMYLYFCEDMSHSQIAEVIGCSLSNVKNKLYRTLGEIREKENRYERK